MEHGGLYVEGGSTVQVPLATGTLWSKVNAFANKGPSNSMQPNADNDEIEVLHDSIYFVGAAGTFLSRMTGRIRFAIMNNDLATPIRTSVTTVSGTWSQFGLANDYEFRAGDRISLGARALITGTAIVPEDVQLFTHLLDNQW